MNDVLREEIDDLRLFADPFERFTESSNGGGWTATFVRKGEEIAIRRDAGGAISTLRGPGQRTYRSLKSLLVGEAFANLARLASAQLHVTRKLADETTGELKQPLPNAGRIECGGDTAELTFDDVCERLESPAAGLRVFVVNGAAGVGKSHLLSRRNAWRGRNQELEIVEKQVGEIAYLGRPFFVSQLADLGPDLFQEAQGDPVADLMEGIVRREGPKLTDEASGIDPRHASALYRRVLSETAQMMMDDETDAVDVDLVGLVIEEVFTDQADAETVKALAQRAGALALLEETAGDGGKRSFPHETVKSYFFAHSVFEQFPEHGASTGWRRVPLSADDFRIFNRVAGRRTPEEQARLRERLLAGLRAANGYDYLRANLGGLLLAFAPLAEDGSSEGDPLQLANLELSDAWMADVLGAPRVRMARCDIHRLDVRGADLRGVRFSDVRVHELIVDPFVRFGESVPQVNSVVRYDKSGKPRWLDSPSEWIEQQAAKPAPVDRDGPDERWRLLEKFARISMRQYAVRSVKKATTIRRPGRSWARRFGRICANF